MLLISGSDPGYTNLAGWTCLFFCWPKNQKNDTDRTEMIQLLSSMVEFDFHATNHLGWSVLDRAAAFGTKNDVQILMRYGASPHLQTGPRGYRAAHYSIEYGNLETLQIFLLHYKDKGRSLHDARGWSLLPLAASKGCHKTLRTLLKIGFDPWTATQYKQLLVKYCTPEEVARSVGNDKFQVYSEALDDLGIPRVNLGDCDGDVFWDAKEYIH